MRIELIHSRMEEILESLRLIEENAIQNVIDVCAIINPDLKLTMPKKEDDLFEGLARTGILPKERVAKLRLMKGFRNILLHRYGKINDRLAFEVLREHLDDVHDFVELIDKFLEGQK